MEYYNNISKTIDLNVNYKLIDKICCDLWWLMGADVATVDMDGFLNQGFDYDHVILDVVPNSVYEFNASFEFDHHDTILKYDIKKVG